MIRLFGASETVRVATTTAAPVSVLAVYSDYDGVSASQGKQRTSISSATTTTVISAPGVNGDRIVHGMTIRNTHASLATTVTVQDYDGTTATEIYRVTLAAGEQAIFSRAQGWTYFNAQGQPKESQSQGSSAAAISEINLVVLAADVTNNNAVANSIADVTGLSFPVVAGQSFQFEFFIDYTAAATTTGSRWSINGPAFSRLAYCSQYSLTVTGHTLNNLVAYNMPAASSASSAATAGNFAYISGFITPSADGNVIARFASEIAGSAIVAKAGSLLKWVRTL